MQEWRGGAAAQRWFPLPFLDHSSSFVQVLVPLGLTFAVLVLAAAVAGATSLSGAAVILAMLPSVALMGVTTALIQGGLFGLAGLCPPIYVQVSIWGVSLMSAGLCSLPVAWLLAWPLFFGHACAHASAELHDQRIPLLGQGAPQMGPAWAGKCLAGAVTHPTSVDLAVTIELL